jgi:hypothetical protein
VDAKVIIIRRKCDDLVDILKIVASQSYGNGRDDGSWCRAHLQMTVVQ